MSAMRADADRLHAPTTERAQSQKGSALVEFALILPIFLMLIFGMVTFSLALYNKTVLTMATREGARAGAKYVANRTNTLIKSNATTAVTGACGNHLISFGTAMTPIITFNADPITDKILTVKARVNYTGLYIFSISIPISAQSSMRLE